MRLPRGTRAGTPAPSATRRTARGTRRLGGSARRAEPPTVERCGRAGHPRRPTSSSLSCHRRIRHFTWHGPLLAGSGAQHLAPVLSMIAWRIGASSFTTDFGSSPLTTIRVNVSTYTLLKLPPSAPRPIGSSDFRASLARCVFLTAVFMLRRPTPSRFDSLEPTTGKKPTDPSVRACTGTLFIHLISCLAPDGFGAV